MGSVYSKTSWKTATKKCDNCSWGETCSLQLFQKVQLLQFLEYDGHDLGSDVHEAVSSRTRRGRGSWEIFEARTRQKNRGRGEAAISHKIHEQCI